MRTLWLWFFLSCKRYVHRLSFLVILLLLPVVTLGVRGLEQKEGTWIRIVLCVEGEGENLPERQGEIPGPEFADSVPLEWALAFDLAARGEEAGMFRFELCDSEDQVKEEVASRRAECGYVIAADLEEKLDAKKYKRCIRVYSAPSTVTAQLSTEVVFSMLMARYDKELFQDYVADGEAFRPLADQAGRERLRQESGALYDAWMEQGGTFRFVYETAENGDRPDRARTGSGQDQEAGQEREASQAQEAGQGGNVSAPEPVPGIRSAHTAPSLFPVRGIVAVYVFVAGLYSAAVSLADERKGLFLALPASCRIPCQLAAMAAPASLAALSGLAALASGGSLGTGHPGQGAAAAWPGLLGQPGQLMEEIAIMALYAAAVVLFSWALRMVCRREAVVCCLIPFFLTGSLLFCPVIVDIGRYIPAMNHVGRLFLPWYYLRMF